MDDIMLMVTPLSIMTLLMRTSLIWVVIKSVNSCSFGLSDGILDGLNDMVVDAFKAPTKFVKDEGSYEGKDIDWRALIMTCLSEYYVSTSSYNDILMGSWCNYFITTFCTEVDDKGGATSIETLSLGNIFWLTLNASRAYPKNLWEQCLWALLFFRSK